MVYLSELCSFITRKIKYIWRFIMTTNEKALKLHEELNGKLSTEAKCHVKTREDLSLAYTPGVAEPCRKIATNPDDVYKYTWKANTVALFQQRNRHQK